MADHSVASPQQDPKEASMANHTGERTMANHNGIYHRYHRKTNGLHELNVLFPDLEYDLYGDLLQDIKIRGKVQEAIIKLDGQILDGRHRLRACKEANVEPIFEEIPEGIESKEYVYQVVLNNVFGRGDLSRNQIALIAAGCILYFRRKYGDNGVKVTKTSLLQEAVEKFNVGRQTISRAFDILSHDDSILRWKLIKDIRDRGKSVADAYEEIEKTKPTPPPPPDPTLYEILQPRIEEALKQAIQEAEKEWMIAKEKEIWDELTARMEQEKAELTAQMEKKIRALEEIIDSLKRI